MPRPLASHLSLGLDTFATLEARVMITRAVPSHYIWRCHLTCAHSCGELCGIWNMFATSVCCLHVWTLAMHIAASLLWIRRLICKECWCNKHFVFSEPLSSIVSFQDSCYWPGFICQTNIDFKQHCSFLQTRTSKYSFKSSHITPWNSLGRVLRPYIAAGSKQLAVAKRWRKAAQAVMCSQKAIIRLMCRKAAWQLCSRASKTMVCPVALAGQQSKGSEIRHCQKICFSLRQLVLQRKKFALCIQSSCSNLWSKQFLPWSSW